MSKEETNNSLKKDMVNVKSLSMWPPGYGTPREAHSTTQKWTIAAVPFYEVKWSDMKAKYDYSYLDYVLCI